LTALNQPRPAQTNAVAISTADWGVVLLAHGSQRGTDSSECSCSWREISKPDWCQLCPSTPEGLKEVAKRLQQALGLDEDRIVVSCLEFLPPHPDEALRQLEQRGLRRIVVMPFLLGHGKHATLELEELLDEARRKLPQVHLSMAEGLGAHAQLADLVVRRVRDIMPHSSYGTGGQGNVGVLVVKAGTKNQYDDCQWLFELGQMVENRLGSGFAVDVAQSHYGDPTMEDAATRLIEDRGISSLICVPYLLFPGLILKRNILGSLERLENKYPEFTIAASPPLGVDDGVISATAGRIRSALAMA
jgi:sirohydrochlorin ferrochelatase